MPRNITDPLEQIVADVLTRGDIEFVHESEDVSSILTKGLDFWVPRWKCHIEVKQYHSPRINGQMERVEHIMVLQGLRAVNVFKALMLYRIIARSDAENAEFSAGRG